MRAKQGVVNGNAIILSLGLIALLCLAVLLVRG